MAEQTIQDPAGSTVRPETGQAEGPLRAADGWVYTHCQFAHLRDGLLAAFGLPNEPDTVKARLAEMAAQEIEDIAQEAGVCGIRMRSRAEWETHQKLTNDPRITQLSSGT